MHVVLIEGPLTDFQADQVARHVALATECSARYSEGLPFEIRRLADQTTASVVRLALTRPEAVTNQAWVLQGLLREAAVAELAAL